MSNGVSVHVTEALEFVGCHGAFEFCGDQVEDLEGEGTLSFDGDVG